MHIVINYFYHMICHSNVMKTTKKKKQHWHIIEIICPPGE